jgi:hypothetical protein
MVRVFVVVKFLLFKGWKSKTPWRCHCPFCSVAGSFRISARKAGQYVSLIHDAKHCSALRSLNKSKWLSVLPREVERRYSVFEC